MQLIYAIVTKSSEFRNYYFNTKMTMTQLYNADREPRSHKLHTMVNQIFRKEELTTSSF